MAVTLLVITTASAALGLDAEFRVDTIAVTVTRASDSSIEFAYTGSDGGDCGFEALNIYRPDGPVHTFFSSQIDRDALLSTLDSAVWVAFRTLECGGNTGDFGSRGLAGHIRVLDVGDSFTVYAATFGPCATPPAKNC